jgi:hypothetical protein
VTTARVLNKTAAVGVFDLGMRYFDFRVHFETSAGSRRPLVVSDSAAGQVRHELGISSAEIAEIALGFAGAMRADARYGGRDILPPAASRGDFRRYGSLLRQALFAGTAETMFDNLRFTASREPDSGVRLLIRIPLEPPELAELGRLPWELLGDASGESLSKGDRRFLLVRYLEVPQPEVSLVFDKPPRILAAGASPRGLPPLDLPREAWRLQTALSHTVGGAGGGALEIKLLPQTTRKRLRDHLLARPCWDVLHLMCHGIAETGARRGAVVIEDERGEPDQVEAAELSNLVRDTGLRLVVLNTCSGAEAPDGSDSGMAVSVAAALVREGIPAVIAMQSAIRDDDAIAFSESFYLRLAAGDPVDAAANEARHSLARQRPDSYAWCSPVVFLRGAGGLQEDGAGKPAETLTPGPVSTAQLGPASSDAQVGQSKAGRSLRVLVLLATVVAGGSALVMSLRNDELDIAQAGKHVGETRRVCGLVAQVSYKPESLGQPTFVDFGKDFPDQLFSAVIWGENRSSLGQLPEVYRGEHLCVTGMLELFRGRPNIQVRDSQQLSPDRWWFLFAKEVPQ